MPKTQYKDENEYIDTGDAIIFFIFIIVGGVLAWTGYIETRGLINLAQIGIIIWFIKKGIQAINKKNKSKNNKSNVI